MKCDICEEKPAKFLCKNCSGHLCEKCKSEHAKTKMFKKHEVVHWETNEDLVSILHCTDHTKKKLECFCDRCEKPVCTECMLLFHNGHCIKTLSDGYREIKDKTLKQREKIENEILPKYAEVLAKESNKRSALTKRSAEIEQTIHRHTQSLIEMIKKVSAQTVQNLKEEEKKGLQEISSFQESVSKKINALEQNSKTLYAEVKGNPEVLFFSSRRKDGLEQYQVLPVPPASHYLLDGFCPGSLSLRVIENGFGIVQKLKRSGQNPQTNVSQQRLTMNDENVNDSDFIYHADPQKEETNCDYPQNEETNCDYPQNEETNCDYFKQEEGQCMNEWGLTCIEDRNPRIKERQFDYLQKDGNHGEYEGSIAHGENHFQHEEGQCVNFQQEEGQCMKKCAEVANRGDIDPQYGQTPCDYPEDGETPCDLQEDDNAVTKSEYSRQCKTKNIVNKHSHHSTFQNTSPMAGNDYRGKKINYGGNCETNCIENIDKPSRHSATPKTHERKTSRAQNPNAGDPPLSSCSLTEKTSSTPNPEAGKPPLPQSPKIPAETNRKDARAARREQSDRDKPSSSQHNKANDPDAEIIPFVDSEENRQGPPEQSTPHTKGAISLHDFDYKSKEASKFERRQVAECVRVLQWLTGKH